MNGSTGSRSDGANRTATSAMMQVAADCTNMQGMITARRPRTSIRLPPTTRTSIAAPAYAV